MTLEYYFSLQYKMNFVYWIVEILMILLLLNRRKHLSPIVFYALLFFLITMFLDTNLILFRTAKHFIDFQVVIFQFIEIEIGVFGMLLILFFYFILDKKWIKWFWPTLFFHSLMVFGIIYYNYKSNIHLTYNIMVSNFITLLPLSLISIFQIQDYERKYKWNLSPAFLINCAILIDTLGNSAYSLFSTSLSKTESVFSIILIVRLFLCLLVYLFYIFGIYQLGKELKPNSVTK